MSDTYTVLWCESPDDNDFVIVDYPDRSNYPQDFHLGIRLLPADEVEWDDEALPKTPIKLELDPDYKGVYFELTDQPIPLMTKRLYQAILDAGVTNLQVFDAEINDPFTNTINTDYVVWNLVGTVSAVDLEASDYDESNPERMISMDIENLVIDEEKAKNHLLFRLAESINTVLVHKKVRYFIEDAGIDTLTFVPVDMWAT